MAHTASVGSAKRTVDVVGKRLGIKKYASEYVKPGNIIMRQRGSKFYPGKGTKMGRDFTIYAVVEGYVNFRNMSGKRGNKKYIDVLSLKEFVKFKPQFIDNNLSSRIKENILGVINNEFEVETKVHEIKNTNNNNKLQTSKTQSTNNKKSKS